MESLSPGERRCVEGYLELLRSQLGENLVRVVLFGSMARGEAWPDWMPMHSDMDLLVLTNDAVSDEVQQKLVNETYWTVARFESPEPGLPAEFAERGRVLYSA
jgi:predicted nucleotidyltransferase